MITTPRPSFQIRGRLGVTPAAPSGTTDPTQLPVASGQLPDFAAYTGRGLAANATYTDPVTGVTVLKLTSSTVPVANTSITHDYSSINAISHPWTSGSDTFVTAHINALSQGSGRYLVDINLTTPGYTNYRAAPGAGTRDMQFVFSQNPATPRIAYYIKNTANGWRSIARYDTSTNTDAPSGNFPKEFGGGGPATEDLQWLQQDKNDQWFACMGRASGFVIAWDATNNVTRSRTQAQIATLYSPSSAAIDEPHIDLDGVYCYIAAPKAGVNNLVQWDLGADSITDTGIVYSHLAGYRSLAVYGNGSNRQARRVPSSGAVTEYLDNDSCTDGDQHRSLNWIQSGTATDNWILIDCQGDGALSDITPTWTLHSGTAGVDAIWKATPAYRFQQSTSRMASFGAIYQQETADATRFRATLTRVASLAAVNAAGKYFHDSGINTLYCRALDDVNLSTSGDKVNVACANPVHNALALMKLDGSDVRLVAHHYAQSGSYYSQPRACLAPNGRLVMWTSDQNDNDGRSDVFVAFLPTS